MEFSRTYGLLIQESVVLKPKTEFLNLTSLMWRIPGQPARMITWGLLLVSGAHPAAGHAQSGNSALKGTCRRDANAERGLSTSMTVSRCTFAASAES
jgi:hypothetical protein